MGNDTLKTLYVTDLDGTLLHHDLTVSEYSRRVINGLTAHGMLFTYATARSAETAEPLVLGLNMTAPRVFYNGVFIKDMTGATVSAHMFEQSDKRIVSDLIASGIYPLVYSLIDGAEKFSFLPDKLSRGCAEFNETRKSCTRYNPVSDEHELFCGDMFYITCIDDHDKLLPMYEKYKNDYNCVFQTDIYSGNQWLEILPKSATKANALTELKRALGCRLVVFGDGKNDIDMFRAADECYAVKNAVDELKRLATDVIDANSDDGVAKWLEKHARI